jgi:SAM-dependent methyltransferase
MLSSYTFSLDEQRFASPAETQTRINTGPSIACRKKQFQVIRSALHLEDSEADYQVCLQCLGGENGVASPHYMKYSDGNIAEILRDRPIWTKAMDRSCYPAGGHLPPSRVLRKTQQVDNMVVPARDLIEHALKKRQEGDKGDDDNDDESKNSKKSKPFTVVEFCAGSGSVLLPLASMFRNNNQEVQFVLIDYKKRSVDIARERIDAAGLQGSVRVMEGKIEDWHEPFDLGIGLHACGALSDITLQKCIDARAMFVVAPCCVGKVHFLHSRPRSKAVDAALRDKPWAALLRAADFGHSSESFFIHNSSSSTEEGKGAEGRGGETTRRNRLRRVCKAVVEEDRRLWALEHGYTAHLLLMLPASASPKNDVIVGWPSTCDDHPSQQQQGERNPPIKVVTAMRDEKETTSEYLMRSMGFS